MNVTLHFSDTRTGEGRVRFVIRSGRVGLSAEGQGWQHQSWHDSLEAAALELALLPQLSQRLYEQALHDLSEQQAFRAA